MPQTKPLLLCACCLLAFACSSAKAPSSDATSSPSSPSSSAASPSDASSGQLVKPAPQFEGQSALPSHPIDADYNTPGAPDPETLLRDFHAAVAAKDPEAARKLLISYVTCEATPEPRLQSLCRRAVREIHNRKLPLLMEQALSAGTLQSVEVISRKEHPKGAALQLKATYLPSTPPAPPSTPNPAQDPAAPAEATAPPPSELIWMAVTYQDRTFLSAKIEDPTSLRGDDGADSATQSNMVIRAQQQVGKLAQLAMIFQGKEGRPPKDIAELTLMLKSNLNIDVHTIDPWGSALIVTTGPDGMALISSPGPDKTPNTPDDITTSSASGGHGGHGGHDDHGHGGHPPH
jgi:hypothetical protein